MTSEEIAWVAGIIEGEGCFDANQNGSLRIRVEMRDEDVIRRLCAITGVGRVREDTRNRSKNPKWSKTFVWGVYKREDAAALAEQVLPWMGQRRADKINSLLKGEACGELSY